MIRLNIVLILEIVLVFAALMFFHELGHFLFAKKAGIFVREFSLGLGPKLFSFKKRETQYSLRILPFGAYVRMAGEDPEVVEIKDGQTLALKLDSKGKVTDIYFDEKDFSKGIIIRVKSADLERELTIKGYDQDEHLVNYSLSRETVMHYEKQSVQIAPWDRQFGSKSILDRFATILAGPVFNIILTIVLFFVVAMMVGVPSEQVSFGKVNPGSPADKAGIQQGDIVLSVDNTPIKKDTELIEKIQKSPGKELILKIERNGTTKEITVIPEEKSGKGLIGVEVGHLREEATIPKAASSAVTNTAKMTALILDSFRLLFSGNVGMNDLAGPVGIMKITSDAAKQGMATLINWAGMLSLYLGIFNLLPIPALDGSRLLFLTIEGVRGKPIDPQKESMVHLVGFALLMLLMIIVTVNDVSKIF